ncbi:2-octaprenyl-6-methoxyphenyl hydroxylase [Motilimonas sp. 1_MG-2023]|uniref:2-octaprenyl-6-methoxyphenyl hydroxylase n=1 Tax=Motilimonas TaxID=1914248 RepID=UPI0026E11B86|nr:2-octaprenyl-6-methoxyphenyl hydroxylase [Motilimonas sp. 1_MG-2023]MDO6525697.1 2-octaprenyl-6-methoxyphenyl hydroxylase [Motilimonas sp. 1_MG-2023]
MVETNATLDVDLIIVGGGMVGASFACAVAYLAPHLNIALVDAVAANQNTHPGFDSRAIALSYGSAQLLQQIGLWSEFSLQTTPITHIHVSDRGHSGLVHLSAKQEQLDALGYVIELINAGDILNKRLSNLPNLTWIRPDSVVDIVQYQQCVTATLASGLQLQAQLLVGADGGHSRCRQLLKLQQQTDDYGTSAIIANVLTSELHQGRAFERFTDAGPLALLPMSDNRSALVWSVHNHQLEPLMALSDTDFSAALQQQFGFRLGVFTRVGSRTAYPLSLTQSPMPVSHRCVLIGNAAHTLHPVAGQGYNLGLRDLFVLAKTIAQTSDIGAFTTLDHYWQQREADHQRTIFMTDLLARTFANNYWPLAKARNSALHLMDTFDTLKQPLSYQALGHFELFQAKPL